LRLGGEATLPVSMTPSPTPSTWISEAGSACLMALRMPLRSRLTAMSKPAIWWPSASKKKMFGLPYGRPDDVGAPRRAHDRVGDLGIGDQHVLDVARQIDHHRLADAERDEARVGIAATTSIPAALVATGRWSLAAVGRSRRARAW